MHVSPAVVADERDWVRGRESVVALLNDTRAGLEGHFDTEVDRVTVAQYQGAVDEVFADGDRAVNVAALAAGFQTRLPGWEWREHESPFGVEPVDPERG